MLGILTKGGFHETLGTMAKSATAMHNHTVDESMGVNSIIPAIDDGLRGSFNIVEAAALTLSKDVFAIAKLLIILLS